MNIEMPDGSSKKLLYNRRAPCKGCPFRKSAPKHFGVAGDLNGHAAMLMAGNFAHSCHETDPRSDFAGAKDYSGDLSHCVGALIMMNKSKIASTSMMIAIAKGELKLCLLRDADDVFTFSEMLGAYLEWMNTDEFDIENKKIGESQ